MAPGDVSPFARILTVIEDAPPELDLAAIGEPGLLHAWAYPEAVEHDDELHIAFSMNKRHCWLASIPIASLVN